MPGHIFIQAIGIITESFRKRTTGTGVEEQGSRDYTAAPLISPPHLEAFTVSTDQKGTRILARTFFNQLRASGYTPHQVIGIATELLDLVTSDLKEGDKEVAVPAQEQGSEWRQRA